MKISDNSLFSSYNNLYTSKKTKNAGKSQFDQNISNNLSTNISNGSAAKVTLYKDAVLSTHSASGASAHVFYDELSGMYKVNGTDVDGKEYETLIDISNIDPNNASRLDMIAIAAYLSKQGDTSGESYLLSSRREMDNYFSLPQNEQKQFKWKSLFEKENQYEDLKYIAQSFYRAGAMDGYMTVNKLVQNIKFQSKNN